MRRAMILALAVVAMVLAMETRAQQESAAGDKAQSAAAKHDAAHIIVTPDKVQWEDAKMLPAGAKIAVIEGDPQKEGFFTIRAKFPAGYKIPPHFHPAPERVTVLSGTFHLGTGDTFDQSGGATLPSGSYTSMPPQMHHFAWCDGETIVQISTIGPWGITYLNPSDDPRKAQAK